MATISKYGSKGHHNFTLEVNETSTDISTNKSKLKYSFKMYGGSYDFNYTSKSIYWSITLGNVTRSGTFGRYDKNTTLVISEEDNIEIEHNADGNKTITISFAVTDGINQSYTTGDCSHSGTMTLTYIPRAATILSASDFDDVLHPTITYSNPAGNSVSNLQACIAIGWDVLIPYREINKSGSSYTFELTYEEKQKLFNACAENSLDVNFFVTTVIGENTYYSYLTRTFYIRDAYPIITASVVDDNEKTIALTGDKNKLIKYHSSAKATMSATAQKGASINEDLYIIRNGINTGYGITHTFENVESNQFTFSAEDSRGNIGTKQSTLTMVDYIKLTCNIANNRPDALGNMNVVCSGNYFNGNFGTTDNSLTVQYRYAPTGGSFSSWTDMSVIISGDTYTAYADFDIPNFVQTQYYSFETRATDKLTTVTSSESNVKSLPIFHWGENDFVFEVPVTFNAGINYNSVSGISDDGDQTGVWTPSLNSDAVSSYSAKYGWYSKIGQSITIGFYIKATCESGYESTSISISGVPFTPLYPAAGGGMCSGAYVASNQNFQCYVAETNKTITTRTQSCNNTWAANLTTSASGCWYRSSGGEITLSGTISFIANS